MEGLFILIGIAVVAFDIYVITKWFRLTNNIEAIRQHLTPEAPNERENKITYLIALGEKEMAEKKTIKRLVDIMYEIYFDGYIGNKAEEMNKKIEHTLSLVKRFNLQVPDYVTSGEKFIDYLNSISGNNVRYSYRQPAECD